MVSLRVCIDVDDLDRGIAFFTQGLGLHLGRRLGRRWAELLGATSPIDLLANRAGSFPVPGGPAVRDYARHWTPVHLDFIVDDIAAGTQRIVAAGAVLQGPIRDEPYGRIANLADPFGNGICLLEMGERGYDALVSAQNAEQAPK